MTIFSKFPFRVLPIALLVFALTGVAFAQTSSSEVNGVVKDQAGAVVSGATLRLIDVATNSEVTSTSNNDGGFIFPNIRPGVYRLIAEHTGFSKKEVQNIKVDVGVPFTVNIELTAGGFEEVVTVSATDIAAPVNTTNAELSNTVQTQQINDLPLNGRNPLDLAGLQAGVSAGASNRTATINGLRGTYSNLTWDGININDNFIRTDSLFGAAAPSVPGVAEFTLVTQNSGPSDGLGVAQVKLVTPRGTTAFHGSLWEYHRNDAFDANSFFNNAAGLPKAKLIRNQFGASIGGPFRLPRFGEGGPVTFGKDKLFFYAYYEGTRERTDAEINRTVLTQGARTGQFTYRVTCTAATCPAGITPGQLRTINLLNLTGRTTDPLATTLVGLTPLPNDLTAGDTRNFAGFRFNSPAGSDDDLWGFRIDVDANQENHFDASFSRDVLVFPNDTFNDIGEPFPGLPGGGQSPIRTRFAAAWNWTPTATFNNELRGGFFIQKSKFFTDVTHDRGFRVTFPLITDPEQNFLEQGRDVDNWEIMDNAGKSWGDHFIRFGGNYRLVKINPFNAGGTIPLATVGFNDAAGGTPNPLATSLFPGGIGTTDFNNATSILAILTGSLATVSETFNAISSESGLLRGTTSRQNYEYFSVGPYIGDTWRVRPNLTVNLGLRYEFVSVPKERNGLLVLPQGGLESLLTNALIEPVSGGGRPLYNNDWNNFAPSFSFAWDPFKDGKTSVRGGYAISYVIDNNITTIDNAANRGGFTRTVTENDVSGTISGGVPSIAAPTLTFPFRARDVFETTDPGFAIFTIDPNLRTPYVQQWNFGIQREVFGDMVGEVRYVGNHGTKLTRGIDINQQRIFAGGFFEDFLRARFNLLNCPQGRVNPTAAQCPNRQPLQVLPSFGAFALNQTTFLTALRQGEPARALDFFIGFKEFFFADYGGGAFGSTQLLSTYLPNPNTYVADFVGNNSFSNYNALQAEIRQRLRHGIDFQVNYTWSKSFTDFEGSQANFAGLLDLTEGNAKEKRRGVNDLTHVFKANAGYELPFGTGKRWLNDGFMGKVFGGMKLTSIFIAQSGRPISFISARGTLNRTGRSGNNTVNTNLTVSELQALTGLFFDPVTGRPLMFSPELINAVRNDTSPLRDQNPFFSNPQPGTLGNLQLTPVSGPGIWNMDLGFIKRTPITETVNIEFRAEAFNVFNKTNFFLGALNQNINSSTFGNITQTYDPRILQFALKVNF